MSHLFTHCMPHVYDRTGLVMLYLPKVASSSMSELLKRTEYRTIPDEAALRRLRDEGYTIACFVRDPLSRLLSAWRYFVPRVDLTGDNDGRHIVPGFNRDTPFPEFVSLCLDYEPERLNIHVRPQSLILEDMANHLMRLENSESEWEALRQEHTQLPPLIHRNPTDGPDIITDDLVAAARSRWAWDYEYLGDYIVCKHGGRAL